MDGFVADYISAFWAETGRQPSPEQYAQIMAGYTPEQLPVLSTLARGFATFDHWFAEVPSQTFTNRSFFHAASASGFVVNAPYARSWWFVDDLALVIPEVHGEVRILPSPLGG
jgi:phospholipase C